LSFQTEIQEKKLFKNKDLRIYLQVEDELSGDVLTRNRKLVTSPVATRLAHACGHLIQYK